MKIILLVSLLLASLLALEVCTWWDPTWSRSDFIKRSPQKILQRLPGTQKHIIFKVGPPASGKSEILEWALKSELGIAKEPYLEINIDSFVEKNMEYKTLTETTSKYLQNLVDAGSKIPSVFSAKTPLERPNVIPEDIIERVCQTDFKAYFKHRPEADREVQAILFNEFLEIPHYRNIVYESTGSKNSYQYILKLGQMAKLHGFKVHIVYPFVKWSQLIRRSELRAIKLGRLVCPDRIRQIRKESRESLRDIIRKLDSPEFPVDSVLIVNNDGPKGKWRKICHFHKNLNRKRDHGS